MKITHIIESSGGSADFVLYLIKYLQEHHHQVIYSDRTFGNRFEQVKKNNENATFYYWRYAQREVRLGKDLKALLSLYILLNEIESDVIHVHSSKAGFLGRVVCCIQRKKKVIYTPNGLAFLRRDVSLLKNRMYEILEKIAYWLNGEVISCSGSEADALTEIGIKSRYINNGTEIYESAIQVQHKDGPLVIATVGRVTAQKNPTLFNAVAKYFEKETGYQFLWIGGGELEHELNAKNIKITGWVPRSTVNEKLKEIDIYISTALWEGLPFAVLEAMNMYKPLLLSNCIGNIDLVKDNTNGYIFASVEEAINRIKFLNNNRSLISLMGLASHQLAYDNFNVVAMAEQYEKAYNELASTKK